MPAHTLIGSGATWTAADVSDAGTWTHHLTAEQREQIAASARTARASGHRPSTLSQGHFQLPGLAAEVAGWNQALNSGHGFVLIRGFPINELTPEEVELAYTGLCLQLGIPVSQNAAGDLLGHVRDAGVPKVDPTVRLYQTAQRQDFHTDGADIVGLLCLQKARSGGQSRIASAATVYNRILVQRPDLLDVLYEPMFWDRNGEESPGEDPYFALPVLSDVAGTPRMFSVTRNVIPGSRSSRRPSSKRSN